MPYKAAKWFFNLLSINEKLPLTPVHLTHEHIWRIAVCSAFIFVVYSPMNRYYRKQCSSHMNARYLFTNEHHMFSLSSMRTANWWWFLNV